KRGGEREGTAQLPVLAIKDQQGRTVTPAFTDEDALRNWDPNTPHVRIKARALFQVARQSRFAAIVINPFDPIRKMIRPGGYVMRHEFDSLADGYIPVRVTAGGVAYQLPSEKAVPISHASVRDEILSAIVEAAKGMTEIAALDVGRMAPQPPALQSRPRASADQSDASQTATRAPRGQRQLRAQFPAPGQSAAALRLRGSPSPQYCAGLRPAPCESRSRCGGGRPCMRSLRRARSSPAQSPPRQRSRPALPLTARAPALAEWSS